MDTIKQQPEPNSADFGDINPKSREATQRREAKEALQQSFEHGAPETGPGEDAVIDDK
jgi:hypothetical protein